MKRFVPREKMSKKARKELDRQQRDFWPLCPVTRIRENGKCRCRLPVIRPYCADEAE